MDKNRAHSAAVEMIAEGRLLEAKQLIREFGLYGVLGMEHLRAVLTHARKTGFLEHALSVASEISARTGEKKDRQAAAKLRHELTFHRDPWAGLPSFPSEELRDPDGPVLHVVAKSYPESESGYTFRTKYTVEALADQGIASVVAVQGGGNLGVEPETVVERLEGDTRTVLFPGPPIRRAFNRSKWMKVNAQHLYDVVKRVRPRVLHAHSSFINGVLATHVGEAVGIPVVYEARGFWEESWLTRVAAAQGWKSIEGTLAQHGEPDSYTFRRLNECRVRERADHVVTLGRAMRGYILEESAGRLSADRVSIIPNAVKAENFTVPEGPSLVRRELGVGDDVTTVGYISSMSAHEGIETLLEAFCQLQQKMPEEKRDPLRLLLVGDGPYLETLQQYSEEQGIRNVIFTGRVPHEQIAEYYKAIDIFVVPRPKTRVTELVTPLKPLEAFAAGRAVVLSYLPAFQEFREALGEGIGAYVAGDVSGLADALESLVCQPETRRLMGARAADWVRSARQWVDNAQKLRETYSALGV